MTCTEEYQERIEYTFHAFCKVVIRNAMYTALRTRSRKNKREISIDYLTEEKHYPLGTEDEYFIVPEPDEQYMLILCGDTVLFDNGLRCSSIFVTFTLKKIIDWNISFQTVSCIHLMNVDVYDCNSHIHNPTCFHLTLDLFQNRFCRINSDLNVPQKLSIGELS